MLLASTTPLPEPSDSSVHLLSASLDPDPKATAPGLASCCICIKVGTGQEDRRHGLVTQLCLSPENENTPYGARIRPISLEFIDQVPSATEWAVWKSQLWLPQRWLTPLSKAPLGQLSPHRFHRRHRVHVVVQVECASEAAARTTWLTTITRPKMWLNCDGLWVAL